MPLLPPGVCWICDQSPNQDEYRVIDTFRNARPGGATVHESVRKYICEPCAREMGTAVGLVDGAEVADLEAELADTRESLDRVNAKLEVERESKVRVVVADEVADVVAETVRAELAKQTKPRVTKVKAADAPV